MTLRCANGWPALEADSKLLHTWIVDGASGVTRLRMRNGSVGFCLGHLALGFDRRVEGLVEPLLDDWSWAFRAIRGYEAAGILSNHAGYAIDLNATDHPLGVPARDTFSAEEIKVIRHIVDRYDGVITWGGEWSRPDGMHFEISEGAEMRDVERVARRLMDTPRGDRLLGANPDQRAVILS